MSTDGEGIIALQSILRCHRGLAGARLQRGEAARLCALLRTQLHHAAGWAAKILLTALCTGKPVLSIPNWLMLMKWKIVRISSS